MSVLGPVAALAFPETWYLPTIAKGIFQTLFSRWYRCQTGRHREQSLLQPVENWHPCLRTHRGSFKATAGQDILCLPAPISKVTPGVTPRKLLSRFKVQSWHPQVVALALSSFPHISVPAEAADVHPQLYHTQHRVGWG